MKFSALLIAAVTFSSATAVLEFTNTVFNNVTAGKPFTFTWADAKGPVTITLKNGDPKHLDTVSVITSGQTGTSYTWDVPATLAADTYAFEIADGVSKPNYSVQTQLIGGVVSSSSASKSGSASVTSTGTSSSASASATGFTNSTTSSESSSSSGTATGTKTSTSTRTSTSSTHSGSATSSQTSAPNAGSVGFTSNLAFVFVAVAALMTLN